MHISVYVYMRMCELWVFILKCMKIAYLPLEPTHAHICFSQHGETGNNIRKKKERKEESFGEVNHTLFLSEAVALTAILYHITLMLPFRRTLKSVKSSTMSKFLGTS